MANLEEQQSNPSNDLRLSADLEEHYAEIGRTVVENAAAQVRDRMARMKNPTTDDLKQVVVAVPVWVTAGPPAEGARPKDNVGDICCICTRGFDDVIICRGSCCVW